MSAAPPRDAGSARRRPISGDDRARPDLEDPAPPAAATAPSFDALYAAEFAWMHRTLRRLGGRERDLEDLAHDVFVVAYRSLAKYDPSRPVRPWLFGIAFRVVSDYRRRSRFSREALSDNEPAEASARTTGTAEGDPESDALRAEDRALVLRALAALPLDQRAVFVAHEIDGTSIPELQQSLGLSSSTVFAPAPRAGEVHLGGDRAAAAEGAPRPAAARRTP
ncbi:MAG: sigma-70 family RNA polymerase sigma factor [Myxococcota bacterium]